MWTLIFIGIAAFLRLYRIGELAEFLGDQGRTMLLMKQFMEGGVVPLVGPTTLSGHHLGPIFYYLLAPGYLVFGGEPLGMSIWMATLGILSVLILYLVSRQMFGVWPARAVSLLWAVSPNIVQADRTIWEPNMVPLFSLLFVYVLYTLHRKWSRWLWAALGAVCGVLVQLHYPNVFFIGLLGIYMIGAITVRIHKARDVIPAVLFWLIGFIITLLPFLWYEYTVGFRDITGIAAVMASGGGAPVGKRVMASLWLEYATRVLGRAVPMMSLIPSGVALVLWAGFTLMHPTKKNIFLSVWLFLGLTPMARFSWIVHDHYLYFLLPVPFLMIASLLSAIRGPFVRIAAAGAVVLACFFQLAQLDVFKPGRGDIPRTRQAVKYVRSLVGDASFSFTLINSKSFSDLHYRYYMDQAGLTPQPITGSFDMLVLICDQPDCPSPKTLIKDRELQVLCYEARCEGLYPKITLFNQWQYTTMKIVKLHRSIDAVVYLFKRPVPFNLSDGLPRAYLVQ